MSAAVPCVREDREEGTVTVMKDGGGKGKASETVMKEEGRYKREAGHKCEGSDMQGHGVLQRG